MGVRLKQTIYDCDECGRTPEADEIMWEMCGLTICNNCIDMEDSEKTAEW